ncbi:protein FAM83D [Boleophthalmus pectinirostris]|uniref:protein FAM83D n=1 Tax=Boleophthalmus pectinirostris TaxID=150288 RepID=UPI000A1C2269|nr:protein FAM83D [Boleophthalmus pectinirostris]
MALSQCLDDSPLVFTASKANAEDFKDVYNERHRLALEELLSGGVDRFLDFLRKEKIPNFLSDEEIERVRRACVAPPCVSLNGDDLHLEASVNSSVDCSSVTYFPEVSDVEPPLLELGWPAFTAGSYRGVTRAVAHFQPSYGESIYSCKEAARRMIRSAREVIAIVTDSLTDLEIFKDLKEACCSRKVPVYLLLDQTSAPAFLKMCRNLGVNLEDLRQMRVRTITGTTYYTRSGARITGRVHERFMLIDGNRVATGSYRFNWTDGKLNSSNLVELSGQISEKFDEEFRILYAQSSPLNAHRPPSVRNSGVFEHHFLKPAVPSSPFTPKGRLAEHVCVTSTPTRTLHKPLDQSTTQPLAEVSQKASLDSNVSTVNENMENEEILAGSTKIVSHDTEPCHTSTQTSFVYADSDVQTSNQIQSKTPTKQLLNHEAKDKELKACFYKLAKERQCHYTAIRSKLEHIVGAMSQRRELVDISNLTQDQGAHCEQRMGPDVRILPENAYMGTWPRARCVH